MRESRKFCQRGSNFDNFKPTRKNNNITLISSSALRILQILTVFSLESCADPEVLSEGVQFWQRFIIIIIHIYF